MEFFSLVCASCGTTNRMEQTHCLACGQVLGASNRSAPLMSAPTVSVLSNKLLNQRYRVQHVIGRGGMGTVYLGVDTHLGDRLVAIKEMTPGNQPFAETVAMAKRFQQEAHLLAGLQHPHLPSIYDHFSEGHRWYLVMSFIKGQTLDAYLQTRGGRLGIEEVVEIGLDLCSVLQYLHTYRPPIIFRDLKPSNIMRTMDGHIYLIDFGIARIFKPGQQSDTSYQGSLGYAPPEQYGTSQTTPRSDIYALGVTLYHLLTGYDPATTPFHLPPLKSLVPNAPLQFVTLLNSMVDLDEGKRPLSVEQISWKLQHIPGTFPFGASVISPSMTLPPPLLPHTGQKSKKKSILAFSAGVVLCGIVAFALIVGKVGVSPGNNSTSSSPVVNNFCDAFNTGSPDFQTAYQQFSASYQHSYSLSAFQKSLPGASNCMVIHQADTNNQAEVSITMQCIIPVGAPTPPSGFSLPQSATPVYLTLTPDGNSWKIEKVSVIPQRCAPPPGTIN
jgi:serine/threonine protein kinase